MRYSMLVQRGSIVEAVVRPGRGGRWDVPKGRTDGGGPGIGCQHPPRSSCCASATSTQSPTQSTSRSRGTSALSKQGLDNTSTAELRCAPTNLGKELTDENDEKVDEVIRKTDTDGNSQINYEKLVKRRCLQQSGRRTSPLARWPEDGVVSDVVGR